MKIKRRKFIGCSLAGAGGAVLGARLASAQGDAVGSFDPYEIVPLGKTKVKVSRVGFGTGMRGWKRQSNQTRMGKKKFERLLNVAYERGVRTFDAADLYGTHPYIGRALSDRPREDFSLISKLWWRENGLPEDERPNPDVVIKRFLKELRMDYIDVVHLHCVVDATWPEDLRREMDTLDKLKEEGLIRAHGVSCHTIAALEAAAEEPWVDVVNTRINAYGVKMDGSTDEVVPVLKKIHDAGKGVVGMKLVGEGKFRKNLEKRSKSIEYVLGLGCVDTMVVGFEKAEEIDDFAGLVRKVPRKKA